MEHLTLEQGLSRMSQFRRLREEKNKYRGALSCVSFEERIHYDSYYFPPAPWHFRLRIGGHHRHFTLAVRLLWSASELPDRRTPGLRDCVLQRLHRLRSRSPVR